MTAAGRLVSLLLLLVALLVGAPAASPAQPTPTNPCSGPEPRPAPCLPDPTPRPTPLPTPVPSPPTPEPERECGFTNLAACVPEAIEAFFRGLVEAAVNPLISWLGHTLLVTPTPEELPRIGELWQQSRALVLAVYGVVIVAAGLLLMGYESVQTRYTIKDLAPRVVLGFVAANLSLLAGTEIIHAANAVSMALVDDGLDPEAAGAVMSEMLVHVVANAITNGGIFVTFMGLALAIMLVVLWVGFVVRVVVTILLLAGAPMALMCHGLPQTEGLANWWWRASLGVAGTQVGQTGALMTSVKVFYSPGGFSVFGPTPDGVVNIVVTIALVWVLIKIPSWVAQHVQTGGRGRSMIGSLARAAVFSTVFRTLHGGARHTHVVRATTGTKPRQADLAWPAPIREWGGVAGIFSPEAVARRLRSTTVGSSRPAVGSLAPRFLQPAPQTPTHEVTTWRASGPPAGIEFRSPAGEPANTSTPATPMGTTTPEFRAPTAPAQPSPRRVPNRPPIPVFRPPSPEPPPAEPRRASEPPVPPVFRPARPEPPRRRVRAHTPMPVIFHAPRQGGDKP